MFKGQRVEPTPWPSSPPACFPCSIRGDSKATRQASPALALQPYLGIDQVKSPAEMPLYPAVVGFLRVMRRQRLSMIRASALPSAAGSA